MKSTLTLCAFLLSGSMFIAAQQPATTSPSAGTPPTFPTDQKPAADEPQKSTLPDTSANQSSSQTTTVDQDSATPKTIEGCLNHAAVGYVLTDASGIQYNLQGDSSQFSSHIGQEVSVTGQLTRTTASTSATNSDNPDSKASSSASDSHAVKSDNMINVSKIDKVGDSCSSQQAPNSK